MESRPQLRSEQRLYQISNSDPGSNCQSTVPVTTVLMKGAKYEQAGVGGVRHEVNVSRGCASEMDAGKAVTEPPSQPVGA